jgi:hypothetical protein
MIAGAIIYGLLCLLSIFNKGWLFSSALFLMSLGILVYIEESLTIAGKAWLVSGFGLIALLNLVKALSNFGNFKLGRY